LEALDGVLSVEELGASLTHFRVELELDIREALVLNLAPLGLVEIRADTGLEQIYLHHTQDRRP
jgi:hypothetical protein